MSMGSLVFMAACSVRSSYLLYPVVVSIAALSHPILCLRVYWSIISGGQEQIVCRRSQ